MKALRDCRDAGLRSPSTASHGNKLSQLKKGFGFSKDTLAYMMLKREFSAPLAFSEDTAYIECVATTEKAHGKGVSTALFQYVKCELPYQHYVLEVVDTNQNPHRLYKKLGFKEFEREKTEFLWWGKVDW